MKTFFVRKGRQAYIEVLYALVMCNLCNRTDLERCRLSPSKARAVAQKKLAKMTKKCCRPSATRSASGSTKKIAMCYPQANYVIPDPKTVRIASET